MTYIEGFVAAVPAANKEAYRKHAAEAAPLFKEFGVTRMVETWGDEVPAGKITDFKGAVKAKPDEVIVFSWMEYPSKAARDAAHPKIMTDPRMQKIGAGMPFDAKRMIFAGFTPIIDENGGGKTGYVDGSIVAVPAANKAAYRAMQAKAATAIREHGATRVVEAWGDDVPDGKVTDFKGAVKATGDEIVVYAWIEWPSKEARNAAWPKLMADPRLHGDKDKKIFDAQRRVYGGFAPILDT
jgi:uncharacterized protein YbaA (DUF1428 family)